METRGTTLTVERGVRIVSHVDEMTGLRVEDTITIVTEQRKLRLDRSREWIAPTQLVNRKRTSCAQ